MKRRIVIALLCALPTCVSAQPGGAFGAFLRRSNDSAVSYRSARSREWERFLKDSWKNHPLKDAIEDPFSRRGDAGLPRGEDASGGQNTDRPVSVPRVPLPDRDQYLLGDFTFGYYGQQYGVRYDRIGDFLLPGVSDRDIAAMWEQLSGGPVESLVEDCMTLRDAAGLCDWAYLQMVDSLSAAIYPRQRNERQMLVGYLLGRSGYRIRFGRCDGSLSCVFGADQAIYGWPFFKMDGIRFYPLVDAGSVWSLSEPCPGRPLSLDLNRIPSFPEGILRERRVEAAGVEFTYRVPQALLDFYDAYPHTEMHVKADAPVSGYFREAAYPALRAALEGKGQVDAVNFLLQFVWSVMSYKTDGLNWGYERWNFPEESCYYPYGDCDDHAILFCRLVRDLLGLDVLLVGCDVERGHHAAAAVRFTEPADGDYILHEGQQYYCCEPTSKTGRAGERKWKKYVVTRLDKIR